MAREIAESYAGRIEAKDSELGGARFEVHLKKPVDLDKNLEGKT